MKWKKLGQVFHMKPVNDKLLTHASNPLPVLLEGDIYRVFYSGRNSDNKSSVSYVDFNLVSKEIVNVCSDTLFSFGNDHSFYSHGVSIGNVYNQQGHSYILFMGWNIRNDEHWRGDVGRLEMIDKQNIILSPETPFMSTDEIDKISLSYPCVIQHEGIYKMWYGSTINWKLENNEMLHVINYASSVDGESWTRHGLAIPYEIGVAQAFSRPTVIIDSKGFHMWYSYRSGNGDKYRIGYAHSDDGISWSRKHDEVGIDVSESGWDSEMICYPFVFDHMGERYMLYNGNSHGKEGFGLAVLEK